jgi:branched-subunit amino acid transport protein
MFFSQMGHLMAITYLPRIYNLIIYLPTYLPTHPPTYMYYLPTYPPTYNQFTY